MCGTEEEGGGGCSAAMRVDWLVCVVTFCYEAVFAIVTLLYGECACPSTDISSDVKYEWIGKPGESGDSIDLPFLDYALIASSWIISKVLQIWRSQDIFC